MLDTIPGVGLLTAVSIMCELGDFSAFKSPKQLFAYFGLDPNVNESGKFKATEVHMSKRGSRIARRAIFAVLRNNSAFELRSPEQHRISYKQPITIKAA